MIINIAVHVAGARVQRAGILAAVIDASLVRGAVRIASASQQHAGNTRVTAETGRALTYGLMINTMAHRVLTTGGQRR